MILRLALWSLADTTVTAAELRREVRALADGPAAAPGRLFEAWVADEATERWGAVSLWTTREAAEQSPPSEVRALIGKDPEIAELFDVEATAFVAGELSRLGLAFE